MLDPNCAFNNPTKIKRNNLRVDNMEDDKIGAERNDFKKKASGCVARAVQHPKRQSLSYTLVVITGTQTKD